MTICGGSSSLSTLVSCAIFALDGNQHVHPQFISFGSVSVNDWNLSISGCILYWYSLEHNRPSLETPQSAWGWKTQLISVKKFYMFMAACYPFLNAGCWSDPHIPVFEGVRLKGRNWWSCHVFSIAYINTNFCWVCKWSVLKARKIVWCCQWQLRTHSMNNLAINSHTRSSGVALDYENSIIARS